jgi:hypothetical protein
MKRMTIAMAAALIFFAGAATASADFIEVTFDKDNYTVGDTLFAEVNYTGLTAPNDISQWAVDLKFDLGTLSYVDAVVNSSWTIQNPGNPGVTQDIDHDAVGFAGGMAGFPASGLTGDPLYLFTAEFLVVDAGDGTLNMFSADIGTGTNIMTSFYTGLDDDVVFGAAGDSATVAPVPVPAAVWLLGSGLLGLIGIRRRR